MRRYAPSMLGLAVSTLLSVAGAAPALAGTFVYVSNAEDGDISTFTLKPDGELQAGDRVKAASTVMPMAVSPDRRFLYAASRSKPFSVHVSAIDAVTGGLKHLATSPLAESFPYISLDVPTLGTDQIFQFTFDATTGRLASNTPAVAQLKTGVGPRHFAISRDNKFVYVLSELLATVTTPSLDAKTDALTETSWTAGLPPDSKINAIDAASGALRVLKQYPVGKGANWVEIVSFD